MLIGQTIFGEDSAATDFYTPWFPRGGNRAIMTCNLLNDMNLSTLTIFVQTKNSEQSDDEASEPVGWSQAITAGTSNTSWDAGAALSDTTNAGFKELVRFRMSIRASSGNIALAHIRMLQPQWFTN